MMQRAGLYRECGGYDSLCNGEAHRAQKYQKEYFIGQWHGIERVVDPSLTIPTFPRNLIHLLLSSSPLAKYHPSRQSTASESRAFTAHQPTRPSYAEKPIQRSLYHPLQGRLKVGKVDIYHSHHIFPRGRSILSHRHFNKGRSNKARYSRLEDNVMNQKGEPAGF